jgi:hypothetical protein
MQLQLGGSLQGAVVKQNMRGSSGSRPWTGKGERISAASRCYPRHVVLLEDVWLDVVAFKCNGAIKALQ